MKTKLYKTMVSSLFVVMFCVGESLAQDARSAAGGRDAPSVQVVSGNTSLEAQNEQAECDARVKQIYADAERRVAQLKEEMQDEIDANGHIIHRRYNPGPLNEEVKKDYNAQIEQINAEAKDHAERITAASQEKIRCLENSANSR